MLVLCPKCKNHYDDSCQLSVCYGPGVGADLDPSKSHKSFATSPISEHRSVTKQVRSDHAERMRINARDAASLDALPASRASDG